MCGRGMDETCESGRGVVASYIEAVFERYRKTVERPEFPLWLRLSFAIELAGLRYCFGKEYLREAVCLAGA